MPVGLRLRKDPKIRPKISSGRTKPSKNSIENADRKNHGSQGNAKKRGSSKLEFDGSELYEGKVGWNWKSHSGVKGKVELDQAERKRKRADSIKHVGNARKSLGLRLSDKRTLWKSSDTRISWKQNSRGKRREFDTDDSNEEMISGGAACELKGRAGKRNAVRRSKDSRNREDRRNGVEASAQKLKPKGKIIDGVKSTERGKEDDDDKVSDNVAKGKDRSDQTAKQKQVRFQTRVLDKMGNKIRGHKKSSDGESEEAEAPPKKRKRVIKIDPYDISNKRLDDGILNSEKAEEKVVELSKNAQFRAIQPSPSILSFVENNLLGRRRLIELQNAGYNVKLSAPLDNGPFSTSAERERIEENVFRNKLEFFAAAKISSSFPPPVIPEIAFAGRSNVGKSSLLNALTRQWGVVRTSDKPGYTQTINFFRLASKLCLVDLPGYGFAYAKEEVKDAWEELVKEYVSTRVGLKRVCLLIDTKWGMKPRDHELIDLMERSQTPYQIVLTKTDAVFPIDVARRAMQVQENLNANKSIVKPVMMVSSKSGAGIRSLRTVLAKIARFTKP